MNYDDEYGDAQYSEAMKAWDDPHCQSYGFDDEHRPTQSYGGAYTNISRPHRLDPNFEQFEDGISPRPAKEENALGDIT